MGLDGEGKWTRIEWRTKGHRRGRNGAGMKFKDIRAQRLGIIPQARPVGISLEGGLACRTEQRRNGSLQLAKDYLKGPRTLST